MFKALREQAQSRAGIQGVQFGDAAAQARLIERKSMLNRLRQATREFIEALMMLLNASPRMDQALHCVVGAHGELLQPLLSRARQALLEGVDLA